VPNAAPSASAETNCRSSVQIKHAGGGASEREYCVPQALQMKAGMSRIQDARPDGHSQPAQRAKCCRAPVHPALSVT
jgi:hypothetical protein